jgi:hypothetical protein
MSDTTEELQQEIERLKAEAERLKAEAQRRDEQIRQDMAEAEKRRDELHAHWRERMQTTNERWQAEIDAKRERLDEILATDQGRAWSEVHDMTRQVETWKTQAERAEERARQAEADKAEALASVNGGENIHPEDPRVLHIWEKAHRIASAGGFCSEYDRIAEALGVPDMEMDYCGSVEVSFSGTVSIPVSGRASRREIAEGDIDPDFDLSEIVENIDTYNLDYSVESVEIEAD